MTVYAVHLPGLAGQPDFRARERAVFVKEGFSPFAFIFGVVWLLWTRQWLAALIAFVLTLAFGLTLDFVGAGATSAAIATFLLNLLIGLEAPAIRGWSLQQKRFVFAGAVVAKTAEDAELKYFAALETSAAPPAPPPPLPGRVGLAPADGATFLFPGPGGRGA